MKNKISTIIRSRFLYASPWLLAAAAGLLIIIVVTFAFHNLRLEKRLMTNAMLQKTITLMRVVHSASRASLIADLRKGYWQSEPWSSHVQRVIDHLIEDNDVLELAIIDEQGKVLAHSDTDKVGSEIPVRPFIEKENEVTLINELSYAIDDTPQGNRMFRAIRPFPAIVPMLPKGMNRPNLPRFNRFFMGERGASPPLITPLPDPLDIHKRYFILVGLDMAAFDQTIRRLRVQLIMLSAAMLLVGIAGWLSISIIHGYRISQRTLDKIQAFTSLLVAKLPVGIIATDQQGRVATWNQVVAEITGLQPSEAINRYPKDILPEEIALFFRHRDEIREKEHKERELAVHFQGNDFVLFCRSISILDSEQRYMGEVLLLSDVSEMKLLEQKMRENERLAAIGKMAGGVAHEVRNPLSSIKGLALLLKNKFSPGSKEQDTADLLIQETERMNRTITEMLSLTRPMTLHREVLYIGPLLTKSLDFLRTECLSRGVHVKLEVEENLPAVLGDRDRLNQVFMNIFLNSLQAMEDGGQLNVSAFFTFRAVPKLVISIQDTGEGMDKETLDQVFYPYFTTKKHGTGIGLAITQKIMADHNGDITIESQQGKGTLVNLILPVSGRKGELGDQ
ncbi:two-component system sensor histidine kinase NtrB [Desulfogranum japonicum]|uniref:two-component system sensor histidine kinase NtrB n=1 Tax=Desulfogranum japonicum TaxID=231447 RepID=UPI00040B144D|nr:ATP-binding protein [Desulfogranum japonicum]